MDWISPIGHEAGPWLNEVRAYDGEVGQGHYTYQDGADWTDRLTLTLDSPMRTGVIKFCAECEGTAQKIWFTVYDEDISDWVDISEGDGDPFSDLTWTEKSFEPRIISKVGVYLWGSIGGYRRLHELMVGVKASAPGYSNCIGLYKMNDNEASAIVLDATGNHNGTFKDATGNPNTDAHDAVGKINGALEFDGTDDYVEIANHTDFNFALRPFSISMWLKCDNVAFRGFMSKFDNAGNDEFVLMTDPTGKVLFRCYDDSVNAWIGRQYTTALSTVVWHHLVAIYDGGTVSSSLRIYLDSVRVDNANSEGSAVNFVSIEPLNAPVNIGEYLGYEHDGLIDAVMIFDKVLSRAEIVWLWNEGKGREHLGIARPLVGGSLVSGRKGLV